MKGQITFADVEYQGRKHISKREKFLNVMETIIPWDRWVERTRQTDARNSYNAADVPFTNLVQSVR